MIRNVPLKRHLYRKACEKGILLNTTFELTPLCNFNCRMCYIHQSESQLKESSGKMMTVSDWIHLAREMKEQGTLYILLTGGEPLLWPDFWPLYEELYKMGFVLSINSNGSMIDDAAIKRFQKMPPSRINITLYGANDETYRRLCGVSGAYHKVVAAIEGLKSAGIFVKLNGSVTPFNADDIKEIIAFSKQHKLILETSTYMFPPVRKQMDMVGKNMRFTPEESAKYRIQIYRYQYDHETYRNILQQILEGSIPLEDVVNDCIDPVDGKIRCLAGKASCWVTWDGKLSLCGMIPDYYVDVRKLGCEKSWEELKRMSDHIRLSGTCDRCENLKICHSCAAMAYAETGDVGGIPTYLCKMMTAMRGIAQTELLKLE